MVFSRTALAGITCLLVGYKPSSFPPSRFLFLRFHRNRSDLVSRSLRFPQKRTPPTISFAFVFVRFRQMLTRRRQKRRQVDKRGQRRYHVDNRRFRDSLSYIVVVTVLDLPPVQLKTSFIHYEVWHAAFDASMAGFSTDEQLAVCR